MPRLRLLLSIIGTLIVSTLLSSCSLLPTKPAGIRLYVFNCGNIDVKDISLFSPGFNEGKEKKLTDSCFLIEHPMGNMIWDTGLADSMGEKGMDAFNGKIHMNVTYPFAKQLANLGVDPKDIQILGLSHFHADHTGNANLFTNATVLVQQPEYDAAFGPDPQRYGFVPSTYNKLDRKHFKILHGDYDVFGDGSVIILSAPGHTPGHQVLFIRLPHYGPLVLSGDLYHFTANRIHRRVPVFNYNREETLKSMDKIENFVRAVHARMWIQHDLEQMSELRHAPQYYD